jgi:hypothetical protein
MCLCIWWFQQLTCNYWHACVLQANYNLGPGQYNVTSSVDETLSKTSGKFGKAAQYPQQPVDRIFVSTLALKPRNSVCYQF